MGFCAGPQCGVFLSPGFFHASRIPRSDVGEGALSKSHGPRASWTSILKTGRSTMLYCSPHETIPASLSRFAEETNLGKDMRIIQENTRKTPQNTQRPVHSKPAEWWDSVMTWPGQVWQTRASSSVLNRHLSTDSWHGHLEHGFNKSVLYIFSPSSSEPEGLSTNSVMIYPSHMQGTT